MDIPELPKKREKVADQEGEDKKLKQRAKEGETSPPSASSSPSHEFSFIVSLHPSSITPQKTKSQPSSLAIDLSPADDIFFHGHLLPLHLLSHLPISPRSSTNSLDNFNLPMKDLSDSKPNSKSSSSSSMSSNTSINSNTGETKVRSKPKSLSFFGFSIWQKGSEGDEKKNKKKIRFDLGHFLKRYLKMVTPFSLSRSRKNENHHSPRQGHSFSGNSSYRSDYKQMRLGRRGGGQFSAPASIRTSPSNSGVLLATQSFPPNPSDSTMEELQNAIQAAIAHCKSSIAKKEEKPKFAEAKILD